MCLSLAPTPEGDGLPLATCHDVAGHLQVFIDLVKVPEQTATIASDSDNDETLNAPGLGEIPSPKSLSSGNKGSSGNGGGGETPYVETGACPVPGCDFHPEEFKELRGHIGGKVASGCKAHSELAVRIDDYR